MRSVRQSNRPPRRAGMSLVELMVAMGLSSLVLAAVGTLTLYGSRSSVAMVNYNDLEGRSRYALDVIGREVRQATELVALSTNAADKSLTFTNADEAATLTLSWDSHSRTLVFEKTGSAPQTLLTECDRWDFALYQRTPWVTSSNIFFYPATNNVGVLDIRLCKLVSMTWRCSRQIFAKKVNTENVQAAQIVLRNKQ